MAPTRKQALRGAMSAGQRKLINDRYDAKEAAAKKTPSKTASKASKSAPKKAAAKSASKPAAKTTKAAAPRKRPASSVTGRKPTGRAAYASPAPKSRMGPAPTAGNPTTPPRPKEGGAATPPKADTPKSKMKDDKGKRASTEKAIAAASKAKPGPHPYSLRTR